MTVLLKDISDEHRHLIKICQAENCDRMQEMRGFCQKHYNRVLKYGDPKLTKLKINGYKTITKDGYPKCKETGQLMHKKVMEEKLGRPLLGGKKEVVHHIDMDKSNYNIGNLHLCTSLEHNKIHGQFNLLVPELFKLGIVIFENGKYKINDKFAKCIESLDS